MTLKVLIAFEQSGVIRRAFRDRGIPALSCDLMESEDDSPFHIVGDAFEVMYSEHWDLLIAHPECTFLTNAGVRWLHTKEGRWDQMRKAAEDFKRTLEVPAKRKAVENPIMHKYAVKIVGRRQDQVTQPWWFGHPERKGTGWWLDNLPELGKTNDVSEHMKTLPLKDQHKVFYASPGKDRAKIRARTLPGVANAIADQWGPLL